MLWPHGILFRDAEKAIRKAIIETDLIEAIIGLGPNLFYNSPMESCVVILRMKKSQKRKNKILFINGVKEVTRERALSYLSPANLDTLTRAYFCPEDHEQIACLTSLEEIRKNRHNLSIPLYVHTPVQEENQQDLSCAVKDWLAGRKALKDQTEKLFATLSDLGFDTGDTQ